MKSEPAKIGFLEKPPFWFACLCCAYPVIIWGSACFLIEGSWIKVDRGVIEYIFSVCWLLTPLLAILLLVYNKWARRNILFILLCWYIQSELRGLTFCSYELATVKSYQTVFGKLK